MTPQPAAQQGGKYQRKVRNFLLDSRFQLKFAGYFVVMTLIVAVLLGVFLVRTTSSFFEQMNRSVESRAKAAETSRELGTCSLNNDLAKNMNDPEFAKTLEARSKAIDAAFEAEARSVEKQRTELVSQQQVTLALVLGALVAFIALIAFGAIVITHRIVGPLFRIKRMAREVSGGALRPPTYGLRPGDELKDVFEIFAEMVTQLRGRAEGDLKAVDAALVGDKAALEQLKKTLTDRLDQK